MYLLYNSIFLLVLLQCSSAQFNFCALLPLLLQAHLISNNMADNSALEFSSRLANFSINLYGKLSVLKPNENLVFSPFSIQTCAAMARMGAEGETAKELDQGLGLMEGNLEEIAENYYKLLSTYEKSNILRIANKIYVKQNLALRNVFSKLIADKFLSTVENLDFADREKAAATINNWVEERTNHLIKDLIPVEALDRYTALVLINAIHFKGEWVHKFPEYRTRDEQFYLNEDNNINVPMMNIQENFRYADLPDLDATALEMPYKDSDLSMVVILPKSRTGLPNLEQKLKSLTIGSVTEKFQSTEVIVKFPKFKAEFEIKLNEVFKQLGMSRMFTNDAEFGKILQNADDLTVSLIIHKAFIEVNEQGTEAAAATGIVMMLGSAPTFQEPIRFYANYPFYYYIVNKKNTVLFAGRLLNP